MPLVYVVEIFGLLVLQKQNRKKGASSLVTMTSKWGPVVKIRMEEKCQSILLKFTKIF